MRAGSILTQQNLVPPTINHRTAKSVSTLFTFKATFGAFCASPKGKKGFFELRISQTYFRS